MKLSHLLKLFALVVLAASLSIGDADAQSRRDKKEEEKVDYPDATRESPKAAVSPRLGKDIQKLVDMFNDGEDMAGTIALAEKVLANDRAKPYDRAISLQIAGNAAFGMDDYPTAIGYLERAIEENALPNNAHYATMQLLATLYGQEDMVDQAVAMIDRLFAETRSQDPELFAVQGNVFYNAGRYAEAIDVLKKAIDAQEKAGAEVEDNWLRMLLDSYAQENRNAEALALAEELYRRSPDDKRAMLNLAALYGDNDQPAKAAELLDGARARGMLTEQRDYENLYATYYNLGDMEAKAAEVIREGLDKDILPADVRTYTYLAQALYFSEQLEPAIEAYRQAAAVDTTGESDLALAKILGNEPDREAEAVKAGQEALRKGIKQPGEAWMVIGRAEYYLDRLEQAKQAYREAMKDPSTAEQARKTLAQISR